MNGRNNPKCKVLSQQWFILLSTILLISVLTTLKNPRFLMLNNVTNIFEQIAVLGLVATGAIIPIIPGSFDMSVGAVTGLSSRLIAMMMNVGVLVPAAAAAGILTAMLCVFFSGVLAILFKASSSITSLATTSVCTGVALYLIKGVIQTVYGKFDTMSRSRLFGAVLLIFIISLIGCVVAGIILRYTQIERRIFAIGSSEETAFPSDIRVTRNKLVFLALNGSFVGPVAVLLPSRVGLALSFMGTGYGLQAMGVMVVGKTPINDGKGSIVGASFGVLFTGLISNMLSTLGVNSCLQEIVSDTLIIIPLGISAIRVHMLAKNWGDS